MTEYESESETSIGSTLPHIPSPLPTFRISQHDYPTIIRQLQEQLVVQQAQIQALLAEETVAGRGVEERMTNLNVAKL